MIVNFEDRKYEFPDDATDQEISLALAKHAPATWSRTLAAMPEAALAGAQKGIGGAVQALAEFDLPVSPFPAGAAVMELLTDPKGRAERQKAKAESPLAKAGAGIYESGDILEEEATPRNMNFWQRAAISGTTSVSQMLPALAVSAAAGSPVPAVTGATAMAGGTTYGETRKEGFGIDRSMGHMAIDAAAEAFFEYIPTKFILDNLGGPVLKLLLGTLVTEGYTEALTTAVNSANAMMSTRPDMTWKEYGQSILDTLGTVAVSTPLLAGGARMMRPLAPKGPDNAPLSPPSPDTTPPTTPSAAAPAETAPTPPPFDQPTETAPPDQAAAIDLAIKQLDPEKLTAEDVARAKEEVAKAEKLRKSPEIPGAEAAWLPMLSANTGEIGADPVVAAEKTDQVATLRQAGLHTKYAEINPNNTVPRNEREFSWSTNADFVGKTAKQVMPEPGTHVLGIESADRPMEFLVAFAETFEQWRKKHLPGATFLILNESLDTGTTTGQHSSSAPGLHTIIPPVLRSPIKGLKEFNKNAQVAPFYVASHEFGHALIEDKFFGNLSPELAGAIRRAAQQGTVPSELVSQLPAEKAAVVQEFNAIKAQLLAGTITAQELIDTWLGPAKLGRKTFLSKLGVAPTAPGLDVLKAIVRQQIQQAEEEGFGRKALAAMRKKTMNEYFGIDEYLAEQTARHAHAAKWDKSTPLGKFFGEALESLRKFFIDLKGTDFVKPGTAFKDWIEGLSKIDRAATPKKAQVGAKLHAGKKGHAAPTKTVESTVQLSPKRKKSGFTPKQNIFNTPELKRNTSFAWRSMGAAEFRKLLVGEMTYSGDKAATKGNFLAGIPESAAQFGGKGRYLVEFAGVKIAGDEGLVAGTTATRDNISAVWQHDGSQWVEMTAPFTVKEVRKTALKPKVEKVQHNVETSTDEDRAKQGRRLTTNLVRSGVIESNGPEFQELLGYLRDKDFEAFLDRFAQLSGKTAKFSIDDDLDLPGYKAWSKVWKIDLSVLRAGIPSAVAHQSNVLAEAAQQWKERQFLSDYFRAWFGDWVNDPANASKVLNYNGEPLILWHGSTIDHFLKVPFEVFGLGDIGFHFGTLRASHIRVANAYGAEMENLGWSLPDLDALPTTEQLHEALARLGENMRHGDEPRAFNVVRGAWFIPVVLNLRNPLKFGIESTGVWSTPYGALDWLKRKELITPVEHEKAVQQLAVYNEPEGANYMAARRFKFKSFEPVRQLLVDKGYDGIEYTNIVEGDTSYVAFHPNQVKSLLGQKTFSRSDNFNWDVDFDLSREEGAGASKLFNGTKPWFNEQGPVRRALRRIQRLGPHVLQIQQLAHLKPHITGLQMFVERNTLYNIFKSRLQSAPDSVIREWSSPFLGKENYHKIGRILNEELDGGQLWYDLKRTPEGWRYAMSQRAEEELRKRGVDIATPEGQELAAQILGARNALLTQINGLEEALRTIVTNRWANSGLKAIQNAMTPIVTGIHEIRQTPFFPRGNFGNLMLVIQRKREGGRGWETVHREAFESRTKWGEAFQKAAAKVDPDNERIRKYELTDKEYVLLGLPKDFVDLVASELGLSDQEGPNGEPSQVERLMDILQPSKVEKPLKTYDLARLKIKGYSTDALRSFASFTWHNANLIAKLKYRSEFNSAIKAVDTDLRKAQYSTEPASLGEAEELHEVKEAMKRARDYIMAPENEAQSLRTFVSVAFLGLNIKTAVLNLYGLVTTWAHLTSRHGQIEGNAIFLKGMGKALSTIRLFNLNEATDRGFLSEDEKAYLDRAVKEGVLSQSYAYHLAGMANAGTLWRMPATNILSRTGRLGVDIAMWPFRLTELSTRRATFLSILESESVKPSEKMSDPYTIAVQMTNKLQNDYSHGNRVPFMRGNAFNLGPVMPTATIFMSFAQHMMFHSYGGFEIGERRAALFQGEKPRGVLGGYTSKIWLLTLLLAGYEGLPGMENFLDLISAAWRKWGDGEPIRQKLREMVQSLEVDWLTPGMAAHGLGYNLAGYDISRSIGFGRFIPGTDVLAHPRNDPEEQVGDLVLDVMGPFGAFLKFGLGAISGRKTIAEAFERLPGGIGNLYTAYRWSQQGVRAADGSLITIDKETGKPRELTAAEIYGKALGFNPNIVSENRQIRFDQYDQRIYWQTRRKGLMDDVWRATWQKDREGKADAKRAISEFNSSIPKEHRSLKITPGDLAASRQQHMRQKRDTERGVTPQRRYRSLEEETRESYR